MAALNYRTGEALLEKADSACAELLFALSGTLALLLVNTDMSEGQSFLFYVRDLLKILAEYEAVAAILFGLLAALHLAGFLSPFHLVLLGMKAFGFFTTFFVGMKAV